VKLCTKNYENPSIFVKVTAKKSVAPFFLGHGVHSTGFNVVHYVMLLLVARVSSLANYTIIQGGQNNEAKTELRENIASTCLLIYSLSYRLIIYFRSHTVRYLQRNNVAFIKPDVLLQLHFQQLVHVCHPN